MWLARTNKEDTGSLATNAFDRLIDRSTDRPMSGSVPSLTALRQEDRLPIDARFLQPTGNGSFHQMARAYFLKLKPIAGLTYDVMVFATHIQAANSFQFTIKNERTGDHSELMALFLRGDIEEFQLSWESFEAHLKTTGARSRAAVLFTYVGSTENSNKINAFKQEREESSDESSNYFKFKLGRHEKASSSMLVLCDFHAAFNKTDGYVRQFVAANPDLLTTPDLPSMILWVFKPTE